MQDQTISRTVKSAVLVTAALLALLSPSAQAQDGDQPDIHREGQFVILKPHPGGKGWPIRDLFDAISQATGRSILFESGNQIVKNKVVEFTGPHRIAEGELFNWLQAVLSYHGLVLIPVGPLGANGEQQWFALDSANANLTSRPVYLKETEILDYADRDGLYVVTTFTLQHIKDVGRVRQALSQLSTKTAGLGRMNDIPGSRSLIVGDFAPIVAAMKRLLEYIDQPNSRIEPRIEVVQLFHAVASELEPIISELIQQSELIGGQPRGRNANQSTEEDEPEPKIIADPRLDALIIYAVDSHMEKIKELIKTLDVPNSNYRQRLHFRPLRHTDADELAATLTNLIEETGVVGGSRSSSSTRRTANRGAVPGAQGGAANVFGGGVGEGDPVIIPDRRSNSLIVHASPTQFEAIDELIKQLDQSRPQVLIETALVELSLSDELSLGVELFGTQKDVLVDTDGDGTVDAVTDTGKFFGSSLFGLGNTISETVNGVSVPIGRSPVLGNGFTAGIFKDGQLPVLLSAFRSSGRAKILTMPSVVTNDNKEARLTLERTTSFRQSIRDDTGDTRDSFDSVTATTNLTISPTIASDNYLRLQITQSVQNFGNRPSPDAPPDQISRDISTNVTVPDRYTVVLGGLVQEEQRSTVSKVPVLGDIPVLGWLFRSTDDQSNPSHLFLFVTPRILRDTETFQDYVRLTWEKKLLSEDLFGSELHLRGGNFIDPSQMSAGERMRALERSGALDGARLKTPLSDEERLDAARAAAGRGVTLPAPLPDANR